MKIYVKIGTKKRFDKFKKIIGEYDIRWYGGSKLEENFDEIKSRKIEPVGMCIDTELPHLEYARLSYYDMVPKYIQIKLTDLKQFLSEELL